jgi:ferredoxin
MSQLVIDWTRCDGHGVCHALLPEMIAVDEWGFPIVDGRQIKAELIDHAKRATVACPAMALRLERSM